MQSISDAFVVLPGGVGTLDEFFDLLANLDVNLRKNLPLKPVIIYNYDGYYEKLEALLNGIARNSFGSTCKLCKIYGVLPEIFSYLKRRLAS